MDDVVLMELQAVVITPRLRETISAFIYAVHTNLKIEERSVSSAATSLSPSGLFNWLASRCPVLRQKHLITYVHLTNLYQYNIHLRGPFFKKWAVSIVNPGISIKH